MVRALLLMLMVASHACAASVELGGGGTVFSHKSIIESGIVSFALVTGETRRFPSEWMAGYLLGLNHLSHAPEHKDRAETFIGFGKRMQWKYGFAGFGIAAVDPISQRLTSSFNFKTQFGLRYGPLVLRLDHMSNAGFRLPNWGVTYWSLNYRFALP